MKHGGEVCSLWMQVPQGGGADGPKNVLHSWGRSHMKPTHGAAKPHEHDTDDKVDHKLYGKSGAVI